MMLIGLCGPLGAGKSTVAKFLQEDFDFQRWRMAGILKDMLKVAGLTDEQVDGAEKEVPSELLCGKTPRWAMQSLGTEWARQCIGEDFWVNCMKAKLAKLTFLDVVVIDDIRFHNEADMIRDMNGFLWRVQGQEAPLPLDHVPHPSELYWQDFVVDAEIKNTGTLSDLRYEVDSLYWGMS
jgi:hypothetical protein